MPIFRATDFTNEEHWIDIIKKEKKRILRKVNDRKHYFKRQMNVDYNFQIRLADIICLKFSIKKFIVSCYTVKGSVDIPKETFMKCLLSE